MIFHEILMQKLLKYYSDVLNLMSEGSVGVRLLPTSFLVKRRCNNRLGGDSAWTI